MTENEGIEVLETIAELYPRFDLNKRKAKVLLPHLMEMEYNGVMEKLFSYVTENPYPPTIAEIAVYPPKPYEGDEEIRRWEEEAAKVPQEVKDRFYKVFEQLVKDKTGQ
ncbi:hypothetical protein D8M04_11610 [Oceanobacillus piezotolerans]|uniref:Uncharacterized protein n=1 Tax=Oceanobacillus piezotolerans TaxID=2448030 RepID=A0A498D7Q6_9BACI|nr:replicative helicase loader/inhibitor [Oceanobacillus piezotolerans]RLL45486.1 hypothetical protein D8M04_11610 [Oceanobacillus piezotolerans]